MIFSASWRPARRHSRRVIFWRRSKCSTMTDPSSRRMMRAKRTSYSATAAEMSRAGTLRRGCTITRSGPTPPIFRSRAITEGLVPNRFGTLDPTDGGHSQRASLSLEYHARLGDGVLTTSGFFEYSQLHIFNDFTHYLSIPSMATRKISLKIDAWSEDRRPTYCRSPLDPFRMRLPLGSSRVTTPLAWAVRPASTKFRSLRVLIRCPSPTMIACASSRAESTCKQPPAGPPSFVA